MFICLLLFILFIGFDKGGEGAKKGLNFLFPSQTETQGVSPQVGVETAQLHAIK